MTFWEYIKQAFNGFGWSDVLELVIIASVVLFVFLYPRVKTHTILNKKHNFKWLKSPVMKNGKYQKK